MILLTVLLCLSISGCACNGKTVKWVPPEEALQDIAIPDRARIRTTGDMARTILEDEKMMRLKNADLEALRKYRQSLLERP